MLHKFYETLHNAEEYSFESNSGVQSEEEEKENERVVLEKILSSLKDFVEDVSSLDSSSEAVAEGSGDEDRRR
jgi:hypothetical protein